MAEEVRVSRFSRFGKNSGKYFREVKNELKKVIWPTRSQLVNYTITVLMMCLLIGALIWVVDFGLGKVLEFFYD